MADSDKTNQSPDLTNADVGKTQLRPAPSVTEWMLKPKEGSPQGEVFSLTGEKVIGRDSECDIVLASDHASRQHAKITTSDAGLEIEDLGSSNGTFVNGERIEKSKLNTGDEIRFDVLTFVVVGPDGAQSAAEPEVQKTQLRPAVTEAPATEESASTGEQPAESGGDVSASVPWWEQGDKGVKGTEMFKAESLQEQRVEGGTQIVRGVGDIDMPSLVGTSPVIAGKIFQLTKEVNNIGRAESNDVTIDEGSVSGKHAQIIKEGDSWKLVELINVTNGTYLNGKKTKIAFLSPGDAICLGRVEMRFAFGDVTASASDQRSAAAATQAKKGIPAWAFMLIGLILALVIVGAIVMF